MVVVCNNHGDGRPAGQPPVPANLLSPWASTDRYRPSASRPWIPGQGACAAGIAPPRRNRTLIRRSATARPVDGWSVLARYLRVALMDGDARIAAVFRKGFPYVCWALGNLDIGLTLTASNHPVSGGVAAQRLFLVWGGIGRFEQLPQLGFDFFNLVLVHNPYISLVYNIVCRSAPVIARPNCRGPLPIRLKKTARSERIG